MRVQASISRSGRFLDREEICEYRKAKAVSVGAQKSVEASNVD